MTIYTAGDQQWGLYHKHHLGSGMGQGLSASAAETTMVFPALLPKEQGSDTFSYSKPTCDNPGFPETLALSQQCR